MSPEGSVWSSSSIISSAIVDGSTWVLAQGEDVVPIPGTKRIKYLDENLAAAKVELSQAELDS